MDDVKFFNTYLEVVKEHLDASLKVNLMLEARVRVYDAAKQDLTLLQQQITEREGLLQSEIMSLRSRPIETVLDEVGLSRLQQEVNRLMRVIKSKDAEQDQLKKTLDSQVHQLQGLQQQLRDALDLIPLGKKKKLPWAQDPVIETPIETPIVESTAAADLMSFAAGGGNF